MSTDTTTTVYRPRVAPATRVVSLRIPMDLYDGIDAIAAALGVTTSSAVRQALTEYLASRSAPVAK